MKYLLLTLFSFAALFTSAQKLTTTYLDRDFEECDEMYATYLRKSFEKDGKYMVEDYLKYEKKLIMTGSYKGPKLKVRHGDFVYYYENGTINKQGTYEYDAMYGPWKWYYEDGQLEKEGSYFEEEIEDGLWNWYHENGVVSKTGVYENGDKVGEWIERSKENVITLRGSYEAGKKQGEWKVWHKNEQLADIGNYVDDEKDGEWLFYRKNGDMSARENYDTGELLKIEFWDEEGKVMKGDHKPEVMPEFEGGQANLMKYLAKIEYPALARDNDIEGKVFIAFITDEEGNVTNTQVVRGVDKILDNAALRHVSKMPKWSPGINHNRLVKVKYVVPINFRLY